MPSVYKFQVSMPVSTGLARDRISNTFHLEHVIGGLADAALQSMTDDIVAMYQDRYGIANKEVQCTAYDNDAAPNYPRAHTQVNVGQIWDCAHPREIALCLSFAGDHRGNKRERGRLYLMPSIAAGVSGTNPGVRPSTTTIQWALDFYAFSNSSFPDLGGVDWKFGIWSGVGKTFTQSTQAWVDDEWDTQRRRGMRESTRIYAQREG